MFFVLWTGIEITATLNSIPTKKKASSISSSKRAFTCVFPKTIRLISKSKITELLVILTMIPL